MHSFACQCRAGLASEDVVIRYIRSIWKQASANGQTYLYIASIEFDTTTLYNTQAEADAAAANLEQQSWVDAVRPIPSRLGHFLARHICTADRAFEPF